jgi:hypothetical protein
MRLYHGSNVVIEIPRLIGQTRGLDLDTGFYLTSSQTQAERFSEIIRNQGKSTDNREPTVTVYEFDMSIAGKQLFSVFSNESIISITAFIR